jgi:hypothetical protein
MEVRFTVISPDFVGINGCAKARTRQDKSKRREKSTNKFFNFEPDFESYTTS